MMKPALAVAAAVIFGLAACAPARHRSPGSETDLQAIQRKLSEAEAQIDQLTQRVTLMQIIVDSHQRTLQDLAGGTAAADTGLTADTGLDPDRASPVPETEATPALNRTSPPVSGMETAAPVPETAASLASPESMAPETASSESPPETDAAETVQQPETIAAVPVSESASSETPPESPEAEPAQRPETEETLTIPEPSPRYQAAMDVFRSGDYETAAGLFEKFARQFPENDLADNALYWSGECRYARKDFKGALKQFRQVIEEHPSGSKVPDALLKIGFAYLSLGDKESAVTYLKKVVAQYPFSSAGAKAEERLKELQK